MNFVFTSLDFILILAIVVLIAAYLRYDWKLLHKHSQGCLVITHEPDDVTTMYFQVYDSVENIESFDKGTITVDVSVIDQK